MLWKRRDGRTPDDIALVAVKEWLLRNAGRPVERGWIQRNYTEPWMRASDWRTGETANPRRPAIERRRRARRGTD